MARKKSNEKSQEKKQPETFNLGNVLFVLGHDLQILIDDSQFNSMEEIDSIALSCYHQLRTKMLEALTMKLTKKSEENKEKPEENE